MPVYALGQKNDTVLLSKNETIVKKYSANGKIEQTIYTKGRRQDKGKEYTYIVKDYAENGNLYRSYYSFQDTSYTLKNIDSLFYYNGKVKGISIYKTSAIDKKGVTETSVHYSDNGIVLEKFYLNSFDYISIDSLFLADSLSKDFGKLETVIIGNNNNPRTTYLNTKFNSKGELIEETESGYEIKTIRKYKDKKLIYRKITDRKERTISEEYFDK